MKLYSEADVRELLVFGDALPGIGPVRDYKEAAEFIEAAERAIEERAARIPETTHRLCGDRIVVDIIEGLEKDAGQQIGEAVADLREGLKRASEGAGC